MQQGKPTWYAWFVFLLGAGFLFYKYTLFVSPAIVTQELMDHYSLSGMMFGFLVSSYFYTYMLMQIPSALLIDRYGIRKLTSLAILLSAIGIILFAKSPNLAGAFLGRMLIGFGVAFAINSYMKMVSTWFPTDYFPVMATFFGVACMAGAGTAETPLSWLAVNMGWQNMLLLCGAIGLLWALIFWLVVKDKQQEKRAQEPVKDHSFKMRKYRAILQQRSNLFLMIYMGLSFTPITVFAGLWGVPYVMLASHLTKIPAASATSFSFFGFVIGGLAMDFISKYVKAKRSILFVGTLLALLFLITVIYVPNLSGLWLTVLTFLFGFFASSYLTGYALAKELNNMKEMSSIITLINMAGPLCCIIVEPLMGKILDAQSFSLSAYHWSFGMLIGCLLLALFCCLFLKKD